MKRIIIKIPERILLPLLLQDYEDRTLQEAMVALLLLNKVLTAYQLVMLKLHVQIV